VNKEVTLRRSHVLKTRDDPGFYLCTDVDVIPARKWIESVTVCKGERVAFINVT